ncbi:hypothetical protein [Pseudomonas kurunegalensis]|uniref:hypothetical protein n=1 Tax=Pseudomonas kurunegalensis TaxID=485880 RepID=UPI004025EFB0
MYTTEQLNKELRVSHQLREDLQERLYRECDKNNVLQLENSLLTAQAELLSAQLKEALSLVAEIQEIVDGEANA